MALCICKMLTFATSAFEHAGDLVVSFGIGDLHPLVRCIARPA